jgi:hypothetical protein
LFADRRQDANLAISDLKNRLIGLTVAVSNFDVMQSLGAKTREARDRTDERASADQYSRQIDLATRQTRMIEVETVDATSTIKLLGAIEAL